MVKHRNSNLLRGFLFVLFLLITLVYFPSSNFLNKTLNESPIITIDTGVSFQLNEEEKKEVDISQYSFKAPHRGDKIILEKTLPEQRIVHPVLVFEIYHCAVDVYLDEEKIYTYGQDLYEQKKVLGHEFLRIPLPEDFQGKGLKVELTVTEEDGFTSMEDTYIINEGASYSKVLVDHLLTLLSCIAMITFGIIGLGASIVYKGKEQDVRTLSWICAFAIIIAMWMLCNDDIMFMIISNMQVVNVIEFFAIYLVAIPVALYFANVFKNSVWRKIHLGLATLNGIATVAIVVMHFMRITNYVVWIPYMHIVILAIILFIVYTLAVSFIRKEQEARVLVYGMAFMVIVSLFELLRFNLYKYVNEIVTQRFSLMPIGALIFVGSMVYSYCMRVLQKYHDKAEQEIIEKMAYMDMLTDVYNRNKCEKILEEMEGKKTSGYLINMDLNGLKKINDTYGHRRGDEFLINFAKVLKETFEEYPCAVGRMGGDEFLVIMYNAEEQDVKAALEKLDTNISYWNKKKVGDALSVAYGYACYDGGKKSSVLNAYEQADEEMYASKRLSKSRAGNAVLV